MPGRARRRAEREQETAELVGQVEWTDEQLAVLRRAESLRAFGSASDAADVVAHEGSVGAVEEVDAHAVPVDDPVPLERWRGAS